MIYFVVRKPRQIKDQIISLDNLRSSYLGLGGIVAYTFIIAFIIFALAGLGIRHYIKAKGSCGDCECS